MRMFQNQPRPAEGRGLTLVAHVVIVSDPVLETHVAYGPFDTIEDATFWTGQNVAHPHWFTTALQAP